MWYKIKLVILLWKALWSGHNTLPINHVFWLTDKFSFWIQMLTIVCFFFLPFTTLFLVLNPQVMWIRRTTDKVSLLTVGNNTYSGDPRIRVKFQYPNNWRLHINPIKNDDGGLYMCQVSTHPPRVFATNLTVLGMYPAEPSASWRVDSKGVPTQLAASTIESCQPGWLLHFHRLSFAFAFVWKIVLLNRCGRFPCTAWIHITMANNGENRKLD